MLDLHSMFYYDADDASPGGAPVDKVLGGGQDPQPAPTPAQTTSQSEPSSKDELPDWAQKELEKARSEAAERRVKLKEVESQLAELKPKAEKLQELQDAQKTEEEKLREKLAEMERKQQEAAQEAARATAEARLMRLAASVGVGPDVAALIDISKLDLDDEEAVKTTLQKLSAKRIDGGGASNPATDKQPTGPTESELVEEYFRPAGRGVQKIFGG